MQVTACQIYSFEAINLNEIYLFKCKYQDQQNIHILVIHT